jgi:hypothetical protein
VVQVHLGPPLDHLVRGTFGAAPSAALQSCLSICLSTVPAEQLIHDDRAGLNHRPQLVPVHKFGDRGAAVSDQLRDLLQRHASIGEERDKRVPQFTGVHSDGLRPGTRAKARRKSRRTLPASILVPTEVLNTSPVSCHRSPADKRSAACCARCLREYLDASLGKGERPPRLPGLGVSAHSYRPPHLHVRRHRPIRLQVHMLPAQRPQLLGSSASQQRHHDVAVQPVGRCLRQHIVHLLGRQRLLPSVRRRSA